MFCGSMCQTDGISCKMQACGVSAYSVRVRIIRVSFNVGFMVSGGGWSQQKSQDLILANRVCITVGLPISF